MMKQLNLYIAAVVVLGSLWWGLCGGGGRPLPTESSRAFGFAAVQPDGFARSQKPEPTLACGRHVPTPAPPLSGAPRSDEQDVFVTVEIEGEALEIGVVEQR